MMKYRYKIKPLAQRKIHTFTRTRKSVKKNCTQTVNNSYRILQVEHTV